MACPIPVPSGQSYRVVSPPHYGIVTPSLARELTKVLECFARDAGFTPERPVSITFEPGTVGHHRVDRAADVYAVGGVRFDEWKRRWDAAHNAARSRSMPEERAAVLRAERRRNLGWRLYRAIITYGRWSQPYGSRFRCSVRGPAAMDRGATSATGSCTHIAITSTLPSKGGASMSYPPRSHQTRPPYVRAVPLGLPSQAFHAVPLAMFAAMRQFRENQHEQVMAERDGHTLVEWEPINIDGDDASQLPVAETRGAGKALSVIKRLTPDDGVTLMVAFGDAASLLLPQLGSPDRISPAHRVPCRADVFATRVGTPWEHIVDAVMGEAARSVPVTPLTPMLASRLGLGQFLRTRGPVLSLSVVDDPTRDESLASEPPVRMVGTHFAPDAPFEISRPRAAADGRRARSTRRSLLGRIRAWFTLSTTKRERRKWFAALEGRPLAAQLWGTRPTAALLLEPAVRRWVRDSAALAGLPEDTLVKEWEIYWRRRGT